MFNQNRATSSHKRSRLSVAVVATVVMSVLLSGVAITPASAANTAGGSCSTLNAKATIGKFKYVCSVSPRDGKKIWLQPSETPVTGGNFRVALPALPATLDPYATSLQADWIIARNVCEPLFDVTPGFVVKPMLAESFKYTDASTAVIKLRTGIKFQNGETFAAKDVVSSLKRFILTPGNGTALGAVVSAITAVDATTVKLALKQTSPLIQTYLTAAYIMPASIQDGQSATKAVDKIICTGPFQLTSFVPGQKIVLSKFKGYKARTEAADGTTGRKVAWVDTVTVVPMAAESTRLQALATNAVDLATTGLDNGPILFNSGNVRAVAMDQASSPFVIFNKKAGIMSNVKMRQAFLAALDFNDILASGFGDKKYFSVSGSIFPKGNAWNSTGGTKAWNVKNAAKAKALMAEAGYKGEPIIWYTTKEDPTWYGPALPAVQQLKAVGINIDLKVVDRATIIAVRSDASKYDMFSSAIPIYPDPVVLPYLLDTFAGWWISPAKTKLMADLASGDTYKARKATWDKLQALAYEEVPFVKFGDVSGGVVAVNKKFFMPAAQFNFSYWFNVYKTKS
jgi:peptide/nickel transport system substrate-binding protein